MSTLAPGNTTLVDHALVDEPLLSLDALADAADRLVATCGPDRRAAVFRISPEHWSRELDRAPGALVRGVATNPWRISLGALASLPEYAALLRRSVGRFELMLRARGERILAEDLQAFVAAPRTTVPVHVDRDHHLLLQVRGSKTVGTGTFADPRVARREIARAMEPDRPAADLRPDLRAEHVLHAGQGLVMPASTFHWVENHDEVSIALTCMARTDRTAGEESTLRTAPGSVEPPGTPW
jgi:hypothetical protein